MLEERFQRDPDLCKSFVKASVEGWEQAFLHPAETLDMVMKNLKRLLKWHRQPAGGG